MKMEGEVMKDETYCHLGKYCCLWVGEYVGARSIKNNAKFHHIFGLLCETEPCAKPLVSYGPLVLGTVALVALKKLKMEPEQNGPFLFNDLLKSDNEP